MEKRQKLEAYLAIRRLVFLPSFGLREKHVHSFAQTAWHGGQTFFMHLPGPLSHSLICMNVAFVCASGREGKKNAQTHISSVCAGNTLRRFKCTHTVDMNSNNSPAATAARVYMQNDEKGFIRARTLSLSRTLTHHVYYIGAVFVNQLRCGAVLLTLGRVFCLQASCARHCFTFITAAAAAASGSHTYETLAQWPEI